MTGSIAPNRPGHHGTVVARTVGTVAISCNVAAGADFQGTQKLVYKRYLKEKKRLQVCIYVKIA